MVGFLFHYNFRLEVGDGVMSGMAVDNVSVDAPIKFIISRSNGFGDIRRAEFVSNERTLGKPIPIMRNANGVSPKNRTVSNHHCFFFC